MSGDAIKINVALYGGKIGKGREMPLEAEEIFCDRADECSLYKKGKCLNVRAFLAPQCKFGRTQTTKGYTSRAAKYYDFKGRYTGDPQYHKLTYPNELVASIGDTLYIRTAYVDVRKRTEKDEAWKRDIDGYLISNPGFGNCYVFMPKLDVTDDFLHALLEFQPRALMGGIIKEWREKRVPNILQDLKAVAPDIYERFTAKYPEYRFEPDYIGKTAYIDSLTPGAIIKVKGEEWRYDGEFIQSVGEVSASFGSPWWSQGGTKAKMVIRVNPEMTFEITDNGVVTDSTRFV